MVECRAAGWRARGAGKEAAGRSTPRDRQAAREHTDIQEETQITGSVLVAALELIESSVEALAVGPSALPYLLTSIHRRLVAELIVQFGCAGLEENVEVRKMEVGEDIRYAVVQPRPVGVRVILAGCVCCCVWYQSGLQSEQLPERWVIIGFTSRHSRARRLVVAWDSGELPVPSRGWCCGGTEVTFAQRAVISW